MRNHSLIKGILWDLDGVLADTQDIHMQGILEAFKAFNVHLEYHEILPYFGTNTEKFFTTFYKEEITPEKISFFVKIQDDYVCKKVKEKTKPIPGMHKLLQTFHQWGLKQAIASSSSIAFIETAIKGLGYQNYFDQLISGFHLPPKPQPDIFLTAAEALNLSPQECLVIEDSPMGIAGAKTAGMKCIAVATTRPPGALSEADLIITDVLNLPLDCILDLLDHNNTQS